MKHGMHTTPIGPSIDCLIPVLSRPDRAAKVAESAYDAATVLTRITFLCSPDDDAQIEACLAVPFADTIVVPWECGPGDYAMKSNLGFKSTEGTHVFTGADDLVFQHGWDAAALQALGDLGVCGTRDLGNPATERGAHSTHSLVSRRYVDEIGATYSDGPGVLLHPGYDHQRIDDELVHAAQVRRQWAFSYGPAVEHHHPFWKQYGVSMDATYQKALRGSRADQRLYGQRRRAFMVGRSSSRVASGRIVQ